MSRPQLDYLEHKRAMKPDTVRPNIVLDRNLVEAGLKATGLKTRRELIDFALRKLLRHKQQKKILSLKEQGDLGGKS